MSKRIRIGGGQGDSLPNRSPSCSQHLKREPDPLATEDGSFLEREKGKYMKAEIIDDGTLDTLVRYNGKVRRYDTEFRHSHDSDEEFLNSAFNDFYDEEGDELDILYELMEGDATICPDENCGEWFSFDKPDESKYHSIQCETCGWHMLLSKKLPEIPPHLHRRLVRDNKDI